MNEKEVDQWVKGIRGPKKILGMTVATEEQIKDKLDELYVIYLAEVTDTPLPERLEVPSGLAVLATLALGRESVGMFEDGHKLLNKFHFGKRLLDMDVHENEKKRSQI